MTLILQPLSTGSLFTAGGIGLAFAVALALPVWVVSVVRKDASLADRVWSAFIALPGLVYAGFMGGDARLLAMLVITVLWALRLGLYITARNWGHGEDRRYAAMRARNQPGFALKSLWLVFLLQAFLGWIVSWPLLAAAGGGAAGWGAMDAVGGVLAFTGLLFETVADTQLWRFRRDARQRHQVLDTGLWRYSRHPNYFGECCLWWGLGLMGLSAGDGATTWWCLLSPVLMTVLLLRVSGVTLLEQDIGERRPAYRHYIATTSAFVPWPPRRGGGR